MGKNKIIYGGEVLIDLTNDTITPENLDKGVTAHDASGDIITGTSTRDSDTSDATALASEVLDGKVVYARGARVVGTMPNIGEQKAYISDKDQVVIIEHGHHDGSGKIELDPVEKAKIIAENIKEGVPLFGVIGSHSGTEGVKATAASATPYTTAYTILPTDLGDYNSITQVDVEPIYYNEVENSSGGITVTIGKVKP